VSDPFAIPQLLVYRGLNGPTVVARSEGIVFAWEEAVLKFAVAFGPAPDSVTCPKADMAWPIEANIVAVITVLELATAMDVFRVLFVSETVYRGVADPFRIADAFPINPHDRGSLPVLAWDRDSAFIPPNVLDIQAVFKAGNGPFLLGSAQAILDGTMIRLARSAPDRQSIRQLWQLLPVATRAERFPCEYCFRECYPFSIAVLPALPGQLPPNTISEEQAKDYPAGPYELAMQVAVESGDQASFESLLARRTGREMFRGAFWLLIIVVVMMAVLAALR
jgi:hypothetical protein